MKIDYQIKGSISLSSLDRWQAHTAGSGAAAHHDRNSTLEENILPQSKQVIILLRPLKLIPPHSLHLDQVHMCVANSVLVYIHLSQEPLPQRQQQQNLLLQTNSDLHPHLHGSVWFWSSGSRLSYVKISTDILITNTIINTPALLFLLLHIFYSFIIFFTPL